MTTTTAVGMDTTTATADPLALLRLLQLASPALPVGAFNFSQGLEYAVDQGWVGDGPAAAAWIRGVARHGVAMLDIPLLLRMHGAWSGNDVARVRALSAGLVASRETRELRAEERHMGQALAKVLAEFGIEAARGWARDADASYAAMFALAACESHAGATDTAAAYLWAWAENQVIGAVKLIPLGQTEGQRVLESLRRDMPALIDAAQALAEEDIGTATPLAMMASAWHETQYTRLFRS